MAKTFGLLQKYTFTKDIALIETDFAFMEWKWIIFL